MGDLKNPFIIHAKGWLFLLILMASTASILLHSQSWRVAGLLLVVIWASARFYYYLFYVIERYIDPEFKFSGVVAAVAYLLGKKSPSK